MRRLLSLALALAAVGCAGAAEGHMLTSYDAHELQIFSRRFRSDMVAHGVIDPDGSYEEPLWGMKSVSGKDLYEKLSPSFRYGDGAASGNPASFKALAVAGAETDIGKTGFVLTQGLEKIECRVIAVTDWDRDGRDDSIVICRISYDRALGALPSSRYAVRGTETVQTSPDSCRDYYLVVRSGETGLQGDLIGICDVRGGRGAVFRSLKEADAVGLFRERKTVEMVRGQTRITEEPGKGKQEKPTFGKTGLSE